DSTRADMLGEQARILDFQGRNLFAPQPCTQVHATLRVGWSIDIVGHDQASYVYAFAFPAPRSRYTIVSHDGIGHAENLARKRGIGQRLWIANHAGAKDHFPRRWPNV